MRTSQVEMTQVVLPGDTNHHGTVFGGKVMQWIDICGGVAAHRHARSDVVTASMDELHFLASAHLGDIVVLRSSVNAVGRSSMEVGVKIWSESPETGERRHTASAYVTFVAIDDKSKPREVPQVIPETPDERRRLAEGTKRLAERRVRRR
jgi:acyl-CoA hydrolase